MKKIVIDVELYGIASKLELMEFNEGDKKEWKDLFVSYVLLSNGLKGYGARGPNLPEGLSETAFCLISGSKRFIGSKGGKNSFSFDTFNINENKAEQIKATTIKYDLTSFGPKTKWDNIYFMDFYNNGNVDGTFDVYQINFDLIKDIVLNKKKNETFLDQQKAGRRPRLSIKKLVIEPNNIKPIYKDIKF